MESMSGFNKKTSRYELTITKARWWSRHIQGRSSWTMQHFADELGAAGVTVATVRENWLECDATQERVYQVIANRENWKARFIDGCCRRCKQLTRLHFQWDWLCVRCYSELKALARGPSTTNAATEDLSRTWATPTLKTRQVLKLRARTGNKPPVSRAKDDSSRDHRGRSQGTAASKAMREYGAVSSAGKRHSGNGPAVSYQRSYGYRS
jgi:hypothetical protein